jgi:flagellar hook-length control protein FliK
MSSQASPPSNSASSGAIAPNAPAAGAPPGQQPRAKRTGASAARPGERFHALLALAAQRAGSGTGAPPAPVALPLGALPARPSAALLAAVPAGPACNLPAAGQVVPPQTYAAATAIKLATSATAGASALKTAGAPAKPAAPAEDTSRHSAAPAPPGQAQADITAPVVSPQILPPLAPTPPAVISAATHAGPADDKAPDDNATATAASPVLPHALPPNEAISADPKETARRQDAAGQDGTAQFGAGQGGAPPLANSVQGAAADAGSGLAAVAQAAAPSTPHPAIPTTVPVPAPASPPAAQVAQAVSQIHIAAGGNGQVTIHLQPVELGAVQVHIERASNGSAIVTVQVERPETLHAMQQDLPHLHQALDQAGLPADQRQLSLHLAPATSQTGSGFGAGAEGQRQGQTPRQAPATPHQTAAEDTDDTESIAWRPAGINITA